MRRIDCPVTPEELRRLYLEEKLTDEKIVEELGQGATLKRVRAWRKRFGIPTINRTERHDLPPIDGRLRSLLVGSMLGDGRLDRVKNTTRYVERHCDDQKGYLQWKADQWGAWMKSGLRPTNWTLKGTTFLGWRVDSLCHASLNEWHALFYPCEGRKRFVPEMTKYVDAFALAVWYLDDGSTGWWPRITFGLDPDSHAVALSILRGLGFNPRWEVHNGNTGDFLFEGEDQAHRFIALVKPYIPDCMARKLTFGFQGPHYQVRQAAPEDRLRELAATGMPLRTMAQQLGVGEMTVGRYLEKYGISHPRTKGRPRLF